MGIRKSAGIFGAYGPQSLLAPVEITVEAKDNGNQNVIVTAGAKEGDAGLDDTGICGKYPDHGLGIPLRPEPEEAGDQQCKA